MVAPYFPTGKIFTDNRTIKGAFAMPTPPCILTIAGSDSGGGAGIQADLKTITVIGGFGMSVITALTAQNGVGVAGIHAPEPGFVGLQLKTVREGFPSPRPRPACCSPPKSLRRSRPDCRGASSRLWLIPSA